VIINVGLWTSSSQAPGEVVLTAGESPRSICPTAFSVDSPRETIVAIAVVVDIVGTPGVLSGTVREVSGGVSGSSDLVTGTVTVTNSTTRSRMDRLRAMDRSKAASS